MIETTLPLKCRAFSWQQLWKNPTTGNQNEGLQVRNKPTLLHEKSTVFHDGKKQGFSQGVLSGCKRSSVVFRSHYCLWIILNNRAQQLEISMWLNLDVITILSTKPLSTMTSRCFVCLYNLIKQSTSLSEFNHVLNKKQLTFQLTAYFSKCLRGCYCVNVKKFLWI